jgi:hypothetical protein
VVQLFGLAAAPSRYRVDQTKTRGRECDAHLPTVASIRAASDEALLDQTVAHPRRRGWSHRDRLGERRHALRTPRGQDDQRAVLGERDFLAHVSERTSSDGDEDARGGSWTIPRLLRGARRKN